MNLVTILIPIATVLFNIEWPQIPFTDIEPIFIYTLVIPFLVNIILYLKLRHNKGIFAIFTIFTITTYLIFIISAFYIYSYLLKIFKPF